jgi:hypothetical protein
LQIDGDVITVNSWEGNSAFGTPLKVNFKDSDIAIQVGGSYLPAGVYELKLKGEIKYDMKN